MAWRSREPRGSLSVSRASARNAAGARTKIASSTVCREGGFQSLSEIHIGLNARTSVVSPELTRRTRFRFRVNAQLWPGCPRDRSGHEAVARRRPARGLPPRTVWCPEGNGYGSSLSEETERCTRCGGSGLVMVADASEQQANGHEPARRGRAG
jgi:hypothetical protein